MTPADLGRRAVAAKAWRWLGGMWWDAAGGTCPMCAGYGGFRWHEADGSENGEACPCAGRVELFPGFRNDEFNARMQAAGVLPDLDDAATLGCLLALVREAWGDPNLTTMWTRGTHPAWGFCTGRRSPEVLRDIWEESEAEALIAALEAAPGREVGR
jgi:hypothetical protein